MLDTVALPSRTFGSFHGLVDDALYGEVEGLAGRLEGKRVLQVNSTARGGGVAELLRRSVPLLSDLGVDAQWQVMQPEQDFFAVTRRLHDGLQGDAQPLSEAEWQTYEEAGEAAAADIDADAWDVIVVHDPQPCSIRRFVAPGKAKWVWRCHIDTSRPHPGFSGGMRPYVEPYDALVYTLPEFALDRGDPRARAIWPAIDPDTAKNAPIARDRADAIVAGLGIEVGRPIVTQVSRFDRWKDPIGVVRAFQLARQDVPDLQLVLAGSSADDDPDGARVLEEVREATDGVGRVHVLADRADDLEVNALQTASTAVVQKSLREGFGLTVSEALWSGTPVVGARVGGIPSQIVDGQSGFLVDSVPAAASRIVELAHDSARARAMGAAGHADVRRRFLLPRMVRDEMRLWADLVEA